jgi:hypothetical protein
MNSEPKDSHISSEFTFLFKLSREGVYAMKVTLVIFFYRKRRERSNGADDIKSDAMD